MPRLRFLQVREVRLHVDRETLLRCRHYRERRRTQEDGPDHRRAARQGGPRLPSAGRQQTCVGGN